MIDSEKIEEDVASGVFIDKPVRVEGPIYGIPSSEMIAWVKSWATNNPLPEPKSRRIR